MMSGRAIIYVRGHVYVCPHAEVHRGTVTFTGQLRVRHAGGARLYPAKTFTYSVHKVERIEWIVFNREAVAV